MRKLFLLAAIMLCLPAAMCTGPDQPGILVRTVEVPTPVPCVSIEEIPDEPPTVGEQLTGVAAYDLAIVVPSALLLRAWGQEMHAALVACAAER